jgi:hypothetical protein
MKFALRYDGFIQITTYNTIEEAIAAYRMVVKSSVYQYDLAIVRMDETWVGGKPLEVIYPS